MKSFLGFASLTCLGLVLSAAVAEPVNLIANGAFDNAEKPLAGWKTEYKAKGESWYKDNETFVSVVADGDRPHVARLNVATQFLADNPGVKIESDPIPFDPKKRYRFSGMAKSLGPCGRIMLEGYTWKVGVKPHEKPSREEIRSTYRFPILMFKTAEAKGSSETNEVPRTWTAASAEFPSPKLTDLAKKFYAKSEFVVVRVVAIAGRKGEFFVDDLRLEELPDEPVKDNKDLKDGKDVKEGAKADKPAEPSIPKAE
jgi:hypothetical protein